MANDRKEYSNADPFWDDSSEQLQGAEIGMTLMMKANPTYADVLDLHSRLKIEESGCGITTSLDSRFRKIENNAPVMQSTVGKHLKKLHRKLRSLFMYP